MNAMYIATMGYGVTTVIAGIGVCMMIVGLILGVTGVLPRRQAASLS